MDEITVKEIAKQLRKPEGDFACQIALKMNESNEEMNRRSIKELNLQANESLLEIGMGNGFFVKEIYIGQENIHYTGIDYSASMVSEAKKINKQLLKTKKVNFSLGTANQIPSQDNSFDKVLTINTLYFWKNPKNELSEIKRVLKPKGELIISIRPKNLMESFSFTKYNFKMYSEKELINILEANQFTILKKINIKEQKVEMNGEFYPMEFIVVKASVNR